MPRKTARSVSPKLPRDVQAIVDRYVELQSDYSDLLTHVTGALAELKHNCPAVHSYCARQKSVDHFAKKLIRQKAVAKAAGRRFSVTPDNFHSKINDLVGGRVLHLHSDQFLAIHKAILRVFDARRYTILHNGPEAKVWDIEYEERFKLLGVRCVPKRSLYTSVHYEIRMPGRKPNLTWELQVRSLAEELWGETDHSINYPVKCQTPTCVEQISVLARATSTCTRLVDSIISAYKADRESHRP